MTQIGIHLRSSRMISGHEFWSITIITAYKPIVYSRNFSYMVSLNSSLISIVSLFRYLRKIFFTNRNKMIFKIIFVVFGLILSVLCPVWSQEICAQVIVCDQYGNEYPTPCDLKDAQILDPSLYEVPCDDVGGTYKSAWKMAAQRGSFSF